MLLLTAQHFKTSTVVRGIPMGDSPLQASVALWWVVLTGQILRGELDALRDHCRNYHLATFRDLFDNFLDQVAALPHARRNNLIHAAHQHCADRDDTFLAKLQFDEFVEVLAGMRKAQLVLLRIPLLHWLTLWAADRDGCAVAWPKMQSQDPPGKEVGKIPGPSQLGKREWELELQRRVEDKSLLVSDAIVALRAKEAPGSEAAPTWLSMLDAPLGEDDEGLEQQLKSLANLTDIAAAHTARSLHALSRPNAVPVRPLQALQSALSRATLAAAARSAWATSYQLLVQAEGDGVADWQAVAIDFCKDGDLPVAFTNSFAPVRDLHGLRQALWDGVEHHLVSRGERQQVGFSLYFPEVSPLQSRGSVAKSQHEEVHPGLNPRTSSEAQDPGAQQPAAEPDQVRHE